MANFIAVDDVQAEQIKPFGRAGSRTQVLVKFSVSGAPREFVEIYATTDIGAFDAPRLGTIPINLHSNEYSAMLDLVAGMRYEIRCCPRTTTNGDPDETMDGESWVDRCNTIGFVTEADADFRSRSSFPLFPATEHSGVRTTFEYSGKARVRIPSIRCGLATSAPDSKSSRLTESRVALVGCSR